MEQDVLARLKPLVDGGRIEPAMFFRVCALMGVSFAAAMALASIAPAFAEILEVSPAPLSYADFVGPDLLAFVNEAGTSEHASPDPFSDNYWVKKSGEPFPKFSKAPG
jgi:hypothetical protein